MDRTTTSLSTTLADLVVAGRARTQEDGEARLSAGRRARIEALVAANHERRIERVRAEEAAAAEGRERWQQLEAEARLRGQAAAEADRAAVAAAHRQRMQELAVLHAAERASALRGARRTSDALKAIARVSVGLSLAVIVAVAALSSGAEEATFVPVTVTPFALTGELVPEAVATLEASSVPLAEPVLTAERPRRASAPTPLARPTVSEPAAVLPPSSLTCDDTLGDPCCAFGEIAC